MVGHKVFHIWDVEGTISYQGYFLELRRCPEFLFLDKLVRLTPNELVVILVNTMSNYTATIIKTGNSYALRVPKSYVENAKLELGQKVQIGAPVALPKDYDPEAVKKAVRNLQSIGAFRSIKDPVAWQREIRKDRPLPGRS